ncbi:outer membrane lipoprotein carrier protein LolA [Alkalihalophilus sp. As8PL]|uniref:Outer membrane lipoprotein carrier protein LolA n=1 Tax=Alkalihalophilus sp. As8PL TaxID=3237103 RepID=A0AB39BW10_9BACI
MKKKIILFVVIALIMLSGCQMRGLSGTEVMASMIEADPSATAYYMETVYEGNESDPFTMKEWRMPDGRYRMEMYEGEELAYVSLYSDEGSVTLDYQEEQILTYDSPEAATYLAQTPRESTMQMLEAMHDHYEIEVKEETSLLDRDVFVLELKSKQSNNDEMEIWVDKENWVLLKMDLAFDEEWMTSEAVMFELNPQVEDSYFMVDESLDFEKVSLEELSALESIELSEAQEMANYSFLTPTDEYHFYEASTYPRQEDEIGINLTYSDESGQILFTYEVFKRSDPLVAVFGNEEEVEIRSEEGLIIWDESLNMISWQEDGIQYSFYPEAPLSKDETIEIIEEMR